jgi:Spherulation-specific family 4
VINPHNGPGAITGPDANYKREIARLNSYANVRTIGYVATGYAKRELAAVLQDIAVYSAWSKNPTSGLGMQGIFFDETPSQYEPSFARFLDIAHAAARSAVGFGSQCTVSQLFHFPHGTPHRTRGGVIREAPQVRTNSIGDKKYE